MMRTYVAVVFGLSCLHGVFIAAISRVAGTLDPEFNTTSEQVTVKEGDRAILPCSVHHLGGHSVIWVNPRKILISHMDRRTIDDHRISVERPYIREWNLLIRQVRYNDSGVYECRINTTPKQAKKIILAVQVPPMIVSELSSDRVSLQEGETATLICNVTGIPVPDVTWYKRNNRKIDGKKERIGTEGEVLVIHNVSRMCDDVYECYVDNGVPPAVSKAIRVIVDYAPEVQLPNKRIGQSVGKETILDCVISAHPHAVMEWRHGGSALEKTSSKYDIDVFRDEYDSTVTLSLRIKNLQPDDYGSYVCVGSNHLGEDQEQMTLYEIYTTTTTTTTTTPIPPVLTSKRTYPEYHYETDPQFPDHPNPYGQGREGNEGDHERGGKEGVGPHAQSSKDTSHGTGQSHIDTPTSSQGHNGQGQSWPVSEAEDEFPGSQSCLVYSHTTRIYVFVTSAFTSILLMRLHVLSVI